MKHMKIPGFDNLYFANFHPATEAIESAVLASLSKEQKEIPSKFLYDERGAQLFDAICQQPEYYPTQTEMQLLVDNCTEITDLVGKSPVLAEYGSGHNRKIQVLLDSCTEGTTYVPIDISKEYLLENAKLIANQYPKLEVVAVCADFLKPFELPTSTSEHKKVAFFPGSTIGNFEPETSQQILKGMASLVGNTGGTLIGVDLKKDPTVLEAAYNDQNGMTEAFELNVLDRLNRELGMNFVRQDYDYEGKYNEEAGRIEMSLVSRRNQTVTLKSQAIRISEGEKILLEHSYKFSVEEFHSKCEAVGITPIRSWVDPQELFSIHYGEVKAA